MFCSTVSPTSRRAPRFGPPVKLWVAQCLLAAHAATTIHFLIRREQGAAKARQALNLLLRVFAVAPVDEGIIREAFDLRSQDFEDAVTAVAALRAGCDLIVTRDPKGFRGSLVSVLAPEAAAPLLR
jgi:predicted nucleic acid-binding protein